MKLLYFQNSSTVVDENHFRCAFSSKQTSMIMVRHQPRLLFATLLLPFLCSALAEENREGSFSTTKRSLSSPPLVFGILSQPFYEDDDDGENDPDDGSFNNTYISASYVKWLEDGGARSIPIPYDASPSLVEDILSQVDGVLFPGGGSSLPSAAITIWDKLHSEAYYFLEKESEQSPDLIPLWGTCLGMEFIVQLAADANETDCDHGCNQEILEKGFDSNNISLPLIDVDRRGLYKPDIVYDIVTGYNVTMNNHHLGISPDRFRNNSGLSRRFHITSINYDRKGRAFVSTIEPSKEYSAHVYSSSSTDVVPPIYGVQYHPEKNTHEYGFYPHTSIPYEAIDHSPEGIDFSLYEARFLVNLARVNVQNRMQSSSSSELGKGNGKYNKPDVYPMTYTYPRRVGNKFEEKYIIPLASHWEPRVSEKDNGSNNETLEKRGKNVIPREQQSTKSMLRRTTKEPSEQVEERRASYPSNVMFEKD